MGLEEFVTLYWVWPSISSMLNYLIFRGVASGTQLHGLRLKIPHELRLFSNIEMAKKSWKMFDDTRGYIDFFNSWLVG